MRTFFIKIGPFGFDIKDFPIHACTDIALALQLGADVIVPTFASAHDRSKQKELGAFGQLRDVLNDLFRALRMHSFAAAGAMGVADVSPEQAQIVVNFRDGGHDGAWIAAAGALLNGNRRGEPFDVLNIGFLQLIEELPCVSRETFNIPPLAFGIEGVEGQ